MDFPQKAKEKKQYDPTPPLLRYTQRNQYTIETPPHQFSLWHFLRCYLDIRMNLGHMQGNEGIWRLLS
jgi:hypothetical protein